MACGGNSRLIFKNRGARWRFHSFWVGKENQSEKISKAIER